MAKVQGKYLDVVLFLFMVALLIMLWGAVGIVGTFYNTFIAESPPYLDYDWAEVMGRYTLLFGVGCLIWGVGAVVLKLHVIVHNLDYAIYEKDKE